MSGRRQHFIPQMLIKGFARRGDNGIYHVWKFVKEKEAYRLPIANAAAMRDFYSNQVYEDTPTLDDKITDYESNTLNKNLNYLKEKQPGDGLDALIAAEVVVHFAIRNDHLRGTFGLAINKIVDELGGIIIDGSHIHKLLGFDQTTPSQIFLDEFDNNYMINKFIREYGLPKEFFQRIAFALARENYSSNVSQTLQGLAEYVQNIRNNIGKVICSAHKKILSSTLAPEPRTNRLINFSWYIQEISNGVILPDCVVLGGDNTGKITPMMSIDLDNLIIVIMPIAYDRVLVGIQSNTIEIKFDNINQAAAASCHKFFLSLDCSPQLDDLAQTIGECSWKNLQAEVEDVIGKYGSSNQTSKHTFSSAGMPTQLVYGDESKENSKIEKILYTVSGNIDNGMLNKISKIINNEIMKFHSSWNLERLDGITFISDDVCEFDVIDPTFLTNIPMRSDNHKEDVAGLKLILCNNVIKGRIIIRNKLGMDFIGKNESDLRFARYVLYHQFALVAYIGIFDDALPGVNSIINDAYEAYMFPCVKNAWMNYFSARISVSMAPVDRVDYNTFLTNAITQVYNNIYALRLEYKDRKEINMLYESALVEIKALLECFGIVLGHLDGMGLSIDENTGMEKILQEAGLRLWVDIFLYDLRKLWGRRGKWTSLDEFVAINRHVERLLLQFQIVTWQTSNGGTYVTFVLP